ncbi:hypothetical protein D6851_15665 [Altericroceibacterium spongiae]|uniref:Uncharacterized protein n=1 Tax=Altericroceibacterium spongiae TaxID=2320269 RepID=A0A420EAH4_9SPHN|nr:hypothetical protein [Altericroceibacterium spongiae]RKF17697.1 hypothetical protein D6851_15665 [Altericroceibacterium spongiae]
MTKSGHVIHRIYLNDEAFLHILDATRIASIQTKRIQKFHTVLMDVLQRGLPIDLNCIDMLKTMMPVDGDNYVLIKVPSDLVASIEPNRAILESHIHSRSWRELAVYSALLTIREHN